jgi:hypothetical protein
MKRIDRDFDCVQMKNDIQAKIYAKTKDMNFEGYRAYLDNRLKKVTCLQEWKRKQTVFSQTSKIRLPESFKTLSTLSLCPLRSSRADNSGNC